ncbi:MAG: hypothetical protein ACTHMI_20185 [Mucilaginibacter sp.]
MAWNDAQDAISNIISGTAVNTTHSNNRIILGAPPDYFCRRGGFQGESGYKVSIGDRQFIDVPNIMLQNIYLASVNNNNLYNASVFRDAYPNHFYSKGCYVHVVGQIFAVAGVFSKTSDRNYSVIL